jgi:hypothetical protein
MEEQQGPQTDKGSGWEERVANGAAQWKRRAGAEQR